MTLEWEFFAEQWWAAESNLDDIEYRIHVREDGWFSVSRSDVELGVGSAPYPTLADAKAACQEQENQLCKKKDR